MPAILEVVTKGKETEGPMKRASTIIKACKCGHGKSIHAGIFQRKRIGRAKCNYPGCRCKSYRPISSRSRVKA
jgi:hypothetical protein